LLSQIIAGFTLAYFIKAAIMLIKLFCCIMLFNLTLKVIMQAYNLLLLI